MVVARVNSTRLAISDLFGVIGIVMGGVVSQSPCLFTARVGTGHGFGKATQ
jgi:hypothetical protein